MFKSVPRAARQRETNDSYKAKIVLLVFSLLSMLGDPYMWMEPSWSELQDLASGPLAFVLVLSGRSVEGRKWTVRLRRCKSGIRKCRLSGAGGERDSEDQWWHPEVDVGDILGRWQDKEWLHRRRQFTVPDCKRLRTLMASMQQSTDSLLRG